MNSPSPTSSISSGFNSTISIRNGPHQNEYIKPHKNISLSYAEGSNNFQQGELGDNDTFLVGTIHLNYQKSCHVKNVHILLKGTEKTLWQKSQARSKYVYSGEHTLVDQSNKIWEAYGESEEITMLDIPFKVQLPYNLPDTVTTETGSVQYVLRVIVNTKSLLGKNQQIAKIICPLKRTIIYDAQSSPPYKLNGETPSGIDYTFILPPNKSFNLGTYISIPMKLKFLKPNVGIEKLEVFLRTSMDFHSTTQGESRHVDQQIMGVVIPRSELRYVQPLTPQHHGECTHTVNLFVPKKVQPTYQGRFIGIAHYLSIKFCSWGFETDFYVEESIRIAHILENNPLTTNHPNESMIIYSNPSPTLPPTPPPPPTPPINSQYIYMANHTIENNYYQHHYQTFDHMNRKRPMISSENSRIFYDRPYDGYNIPQQPLSLNHDNAHYQSESSGSQRTSSRSSTPSRTEDLESNSGNDIIYTYPTHLSPPPYRQTTRQTEVISNSDSTQTSE